MLPEIRFDVGDLKKFPHGMQQAILVFNAWAEEGPTVLWRLAQDGNLQQTKKKIAQPFLQSRDEVA